MQSYITRRKSRRRQERPDGVSLVLVMLAMLVLSTLAAAIVFTARAETFASYGYKLDTETDYVAKAGIDHALAWFRSNQYQPVLNSQADGITAPLTGYYNVHSDGSVFNLYTSNTSPVQCVDSLPIKCPTQNSPVQLITYGSGSSNYPADINNTLAIPVAVATDFQNSLKNQTVTAPSGDKGTFCVNAYLLNYQTVNCPTCATNPAPMETWLITSKASWGGTTCTNGIATAEEQAIIQPVYTSNWGNALAGYCSVSMSGSAGVCTDAFNSALGDYAGGNVSVAAGACDQTTVTNVIASGAGVAANGYVSMSSNPTVAGDVTIGNVGYNPPATCCTPTSSPSCGFHGTSANVSGSVLNAPPFPLPAAPTFPSGFPGSAPSYSSITTLPQDSSNIPPSPGPPPATITPGANSYGNPCKAGDICNGSAANPYEIDSITLSGSGNIVTLVGGPDIGHPAYYDVDSVNITGNSGGIGVVGYVVLNVRTTLTIHGQGVANPLTTLPEAFQINYAGTSPVTIGGNGATSSILTAPNASVTLGGGGSSGYLVGSIRAQNVSVAGGYPIHYDIQLNRLEGTMGQMVVSSYSRVKQ